MAVNVVYVNYGKMDVRSQPLNNFLVQGNCRIN